MMSGASSILSSQQRAKGCRAALQQTRARVEEKWLYQGGLFLSVRCSCCQSQNAMQGSACLVHLQFIQSAYTSC